MQEVRSTKTVESGGSDGNPARNQKHRDKRNYARVSLDAICSYAPNGTMSNDK